MDITEGGTAIPYWMEDPQVKKDWEAMIAENGVESRMLPEFFDKDFKGELPKGHSRAMVPVAEQERETSNESTPELLSLLAPLHSLLMRVSA